MVKSLSKFFMHTFQSFCRILESAISDGGDMLALHLDHLLNDLYDKVNIFLPIFVSGLIKVI